MKFSVIAILSAVAVKSASAFVAESAGDARTATIMRMSSEEASTEVEVAASIEEVSAVDAGLESIELPPKDIFDTPRRTSRNRSFSWISRQKLMDLQ